MSEERRKFIKIRGANEHNLKNISLEIPRKELVGLTGLSGSGKSSLAFDTTLYGVLILLCPSVLRTDGEAGCGEY